MMELNPLKHFWLVAAQVFTMDSENVVRQVSVNIILDTDANYLTRRNLAEAKKATELRYTKDTVPVEKAEIMDVFVLSISHLGAMTKEQFHAGYPSEALDKPSTYQGLN